MTILFRLWLFSGLCLFATHAAAAADEFPTELVNFTASDRNPTFTGRPGHWDVMIRERGWIVRDGELWRLWYTGYDPAQQPPLMRLGYATSGDGLAWQRHGDRPLIEDLWVEDMMVVRHEDRWLMFAEGKGDQSHLLSSVDGLRWTQLGTLDVRLTNGRPIPPGPFGTPTAYFEAGVWNLFYERRDAGIWLARSTDLKTWTNVSDEPLIVPGPGDYDSLMIAMNQIIRHNGRYYAVLHGTGTPQKPRQWCTTLAESPDLLNWKKYSGNPLLPIPENKSSGQFVHDGVRYRLYTMHEHMDVHFPTRP